MKINDQNKLFFIIGVGRSGTSLLQEIMNLFSGFCNKKESKLGGSLSMTCWTPVRKSNDFSFLENFINNNWTEKYFVEKTPDSIMCLSQLLEKFPDANYIFIKRNPYKIVLSQLNMFYNLSDDFAERQYHIENYISKKADFFLTPQQYWSKLTYTQIKEMVKYQEKFSNKLIIKYETIIDSWKEQLDLIAKTFSIKRNQKKSNDILNRPSYSSKNNRYTIKSINEPKALEMIQEASKLLGYGKIDNN